MVNKERENEIIEILKNSKGFVKVEQLSKSLFASASSIRRDLKSLEQQGILKRSYGGATLVRNFSNIITFNNRINQNSEAKRKIAKKAAALVENGDVIILDQSSTAFYLADELAGRSSVTVITNNTEILMLLSNSNLKVMSSGGFLSAENRNCLIGNDAIKTFENIYADICFFSAKAVNSDGIVSDCSLEEIAVRNAMLKNARKKVLLCDNTKFDKTAIFKQCDVEDIDIIISEDFEKR